MKKIFKFYLFTVIVNFVLILVLAAWLCIYSIVPSIKNSGISFLDIIKKDLDPDVKAKIENDIIDRSSYLGEKAAKKVMDILLVFVPKADIDFSNMPDIPYPYPSLGEVIEMNNEAASKGAAEGLKLLQDSEEYYRAIKDKALADMPE